MRVISGSLRGRKLDTPEWPGLRPTSDRLRETLFNIVGDAVAGAHVLDLCAGTGAVGIEAISRGAAHVVFVDADKRACRLIARNLAACGIEGGYAIVQSDVETALDRLGEQFAMVFLDAPYDAPRLDTWVIAASRHVVDHGLLVVEHSKRRAVMSRAGALVRVRAIRSGDSTLSLYRHRAPASSVDHDPQGETP